MAPGSGSRGRDRGRGAERSRQSTPEQGPIRPPPVVGQQFVLRTSARQDRAKRLPHWECSNAKCRCDHNWATRLLCHLCDAPRPKAGKGPRNPPAVPSVRVRQAVSTPAPPPVRARRPASPAVEPHQAVGHAQASQAPAGPHREAEARVRALRKDVSHLESQAELDPDHYEPLLLKAQADLTAATEALQRAKPVASQLQACLSRKRQLEKSVAGFAAELAALEEMVKEKRAEHDEATLQLETQEVEFKRLTLLHQEAPPAGPSNCAASAAILALLTPELASNLLVALGLLQNQAGPSSGTVGESLGRGGCPLPPSVGGSSTPKAGQGTVTPRADVAGNSTPKARSRSPSARAETVEAGTRPGGFTIPGLVELQTVLAIAANRAALTPVDDDGMSTDL